MKPESSQTPVTSGVAAVNAELAGVKPVQNDPSMPNGYRLPGMNSLLR